MINDKLVVNGNVLNNRVVFQPMEGCDGKLNGDLSDLTIRRYMRFAQGGAAVIWFEAISVCSEGRANPRQLMLTPSNVAHYGELIAAIKEESMRIFGYAPHIIAQLTHSGRQAKPDGVPMPIVAYRSEYLERGKENYDYILASDEYCDTIVDMYKQSAELAIAAGFDGIDVKCCHGYLFSEFLGARDRLGKYGGDLIGRSRLFMDCIDAVKQVSNKNTIITTRLNASDCYPYPNGYGTNSADEVDVTECKLIIDMLIERGVELVNISLGNPYIIPHINRPFRGAVESIEHGMSRIMDIMQMLQGCGAQLVMSALTPLASNAITASESLLESGIAHLVGFGRMTLAYPQFYSDYLANGKLSSDKLCIMCGKCSELMRAGGVSGCPIRDSDKYMPLYRKYVINKED